MSDEAERVRGAAGLSRPSKRSDTSGYVVTSVLAAPIFSPSTGYLIGVCELLNKHVSAR